MKKQNFRANARSFMSKAFCSVIIAMAIASFTSCDSRKKFNVQEFESNFRAAVAIAKHTYDYPLPQSFAHTTDPYGLAQKAIEIFDEEIAKGNLVFIDRMGNSTDNPLAISATLGKENIGKSYVDENRTEWTYFSKDGILYEGWGWFNGFGGSRYMYEQPVFFPASDNGNHFQKTYVISDELANCLDDLSYTKRTKHFIEDYERTVLSLTKPELVSESESAIVHKVKDINSGYVFYITEEWSADGATSKKSFKFEKE
ncbi:hypothetical protein FACS1894162_4330 [Bacteroidia bacterium]|nr:hypothetical protein FACS1894162_4330 [Bacteroidia bacterium]